MSIDEARGQDLALAVNNVSRPVVRPITNSRDTGSVDGDLAETRFSTATIENLYIADQSVAAGQELSCTNGLLWYFSIMDKLESPGTPHETK